jgi:hypothetical protein
MEEISTAIKDFGFPIIAALGMGGFIYFIWKWVTEEIDPVLGEASSTLIALIDRVRMLDNDLIRLNQKLNVVLTLHEQHNDSEKAIRELRKIIEEADIDEDLDRITTVNKRSFSLEELRELRKAVKPKDTDLPP